MNRTLWRVVVLAGPAFAGLGMLGPAAQADPLTWDWSWTGIDSGTLTTDPETGNFYQVTAITGTWDGRTITGSGPYNSLVENNNLLFAGSPQLHVLGIAFTTSDDEIELYYYIIMEQMADIMPWTAILNRMIRAHSRPLLFLGLPFPNRRLWRCSARPSPGSACCAAANAGRNRHGRSQAAPAGAAFASALSADLTLVLPRGLPAGAPAR